MNNLEQIKTKAVQLYVSAYKVGGLRHLAEETVKDFLNLYFGIHENISNVVYLSPDYHDLYQQLLIEGEEKYWEQKND